MRWLPLALFTIGCGGTAARFEMRPPVLRESDRPFAPAPKMDDESETANALDVMILRPMSRFFLFETSGEARNVNSLDEVPDSSWFTNRTVAPEELVRGTCPDAPVLPLTIKSSKTGGTTRGFVVKDARKQSYLMKIDALGPEQPEISTAAEVIAPRLYWAIGYRTPCNDMLYIDPKDIRLSASSIEKLATGDEQPLTQSRLDEILVKATRDAHGSLRITTSRYIEGQSVGTWRTEGTRADDPNDVIPHEDRRELRGERFLAAWLGHWDSRGPNTFDTFVRERGDTGVVQHYFLDFSDSFGGTYGIPRVLEPRLGRTSVTNVGQISVDTLTFGMLRRPWDQVRIDPRFPNLGFYETDRFEPMEFVSQTPLVRWARADANDLAWMARKIARLDIRHVRTAVQTGRLTDPEEEKRLVEIIMGRRDKILRESFSKRSPLADVAMRGDRVCMIDLGITTAVSPTPSFQVSRGALERSGPFVCVALQHGSERYVTLDVVRRASASATTLRVHLYDLGTSFFLAGIERL